MADSAFPQHGSAGTRYDAGKVWPATTCDSRSASGRERMEAWRGIFMARPCGVSVIRPS